jgi:hypothetical protein
MYSSPPLAVAESLQMGTYNCCEIGVVPSDDGHTDSYQKAVCLQIEAESRGDEYSNSKVT